MNPAAELESPSQHSFPLPEKKQNKTKQNKVRNITTVFIIWHISYKMSFPLAVLQFLSIGPDLIAIWGLKAKKYLAVDNKGKIFATVSQVK